MASSLGTSESPDSANYHAIAARVKSATAVLVDVREINEYLETGVAEPSVLLPLSLFRAGSTKWVQFLDMHKDMELVFICRSGNRAGIIAKQLAARGYRTTNGGHIAGWIAAGLPVRNVKREEVKEVTARL